ncbi:hypothetical protein BH11MYX4_BH11MYX4_21100 [soil metagenome]
MSLFTKGTLLALVATVALAGCASDTTAEDEEDVGGTEDALLAGRLYTPAAVADLLRGAGFDESDVGPMVCTAKYESSFFERATNKNKNGSIDRGLFQINSIHLKEGGCPATGEAVFPAQANVKCARTIFKSQGIRAWYGYRKHKAECDRFAAP